MDMTRATNLTLKKPLCQTTSILQTFSFAEVRHSPKKVLTTLKGERMSATTTKVDKV